MIKTDRLVLRKFQISDAAEALHNSQRPNVAHFMSDMVLPDEEAATKWIEWINSRFSYDEPFIAFAIVLEETQTCFGLIALAPKEELNGEVEIVFSIADEYQGKGYATEAGKAIIEWGFSNCELDYIVAIVKLDNIASMRVIEKLGFQRIEQRIIEYDGTPTAFEYYRLYNEYKIID